MATASTPSWLPCVFVLLPVVVVLGVVALTKRAVSMAAGLRVALVLALWLALTWLLAARGLLADFSTLPPKFAIVVSCALIATALFARSGSGHKIAETSSMAALVGSQAFRLPLELSMHHAAAIGLMPEQMSYSGLNFDILTGSLAALLFVASRFTTVPRWLWAVWNVLGLLLLINIVTIAVVSLPIIAAFGPNALNTWVAHEPYVWLPTVLVPFALFGHLLVFRKLRSTGGEVA